MYRISLEGVTAYADRFVIAPAHGAQTLISASITGPDTTMKTWQAILRSQGAKNRTSLAMIYKPETNYTQMVYLDGLKDNDNTTIISKPVESQNRTMKNIFVWCEKMGGYLYPIAPENQGTLLPDVWSWMLRRHTKVICRPEWGPLIWARLQEQDLIQPMETYGLESNQVVMAEMEIQEIISSMVAEGVLQ